jgi:hypothetical protein
MKLTEEYINDYVVNKQVEKNDIWYDPEYGMFLVPVHHNQNYIKCVRLKTKDHNSQTQKFDTASISLGDLRDCYHLFDKSYYLANFAHLYPMTYQHWRKYFFNDLREAVHYVPLVEMGFEGMNFYPDSHYIEEEPEQVRKSDEPYSESIIPLGSSIRQSIEKDIMSFILEANFGKPITSFKGEVIYNGDGSISFNGKGRE